MSDIPFHHTLAIRQQLCRGCTHCMKICPTEAIRIRKGKAQVDPERCIDCGQCMAVCPHNAIVIEQNDFQQIFSYKHRIAIIPSLFIGQFEDDISEQQIIDALHKIGFTSVYYAEFGVDILMSLGKKVSVYADSSPVISSYCPAVTRLIQLRYPGLLSHSNLMRTPAQITALYVRSELEQRGIDPQTIGVFYITPCAAKYAQIKTPGSATSGIIQGGLNLDSIFNLLQQYLAKHSSESLSNAAYRKTPPITKLAFIWSLTKGEATSMFGRTLSIDEIHNVIEFLEIVEDERQKNLDFLELRACGTGCTGGILNPRNRFLATERIKHHAESLPESLSVALSEKIISLSDHLIHNLKIDRITQKHSLTFDSDIGIALQKMEKAEKIRQVLPGIDCGLCGAPTCKALAEDITRKKASIRQCAVLKRDNPQRLNTLAKIWGESIVGEQPLEESPV